MGKVRPSSLLLCLLVFVVGIPGAQAQWGPDGIPVTEALGDQIEPELVSDGAGGAFVVWRDVRGGPSYGLYMQRISAQGILLWDADDVPIRTGVGVTSAAYLPVITSDGGSGCLLAWRDGRSAPYGSSGIYIQKVNTSGIVQWTTNGLYTDFDYAGRILADGAGGAFVSGTTWTDHAVVQRYDAGGSRLWPGDYVDISTEATTTGLIPDGAGGVYLGFQYTGLGSDYVFGEHLDGSGTMLWDDHWVSYTGYATVFKGDMVPDGTGGAFFLWEQNSWLRGQRMDAAGNPLWTVYGDPLVEFTGSTPDAHMVPDGAGGALIVWVNSGWNVRVARVRPDGTIAWNISACDSPATQNTARIAPDGYGGAFVVWEDWRNSTTLDIDIYAQHVDKDGAVQWTTTGVPIANEILDQENPQITATGNHSAIIAWDTHVGDYLVDIYAQIISADGSFGDPPFEVYLTQPDVNAIHAPVNTNIRATFSDNVSLPSLLGGTLSAHGSQTGLHPGGITLLGRTVTLKPDDDFVPGEVVTVMLTDGIESAGGKSLTPMNWFFTAEADGVHGGFLSSREFNVQTYPFALCPADINGDGDMDLLVANYIDDSISYMVGQGNGFFTRPVNLATNVRPRSVIAADLDGDEFPDVVTANVDGDDVSVFINDTHGGLVKRVSYDTGNNPGAVCAADINGDGNLDLATASLGFDVVSILINDGTGAFAAPVHYGTGENPSFITAADLNNDGYVDLMTANTQSDDVSILMNDGSGGFEPKVDLPTGDYPVTVHPADLDEDGDLDLVVGAYTDSQVLVLFNNGYATFAPPVVYATGSGPYGGLPSDLNGDGYLDLVYCDRNANDVRVRLNDGSGGFGGETAVAVGTGPIAIAAADFDGDGALDLVTANGNSNDVSFLKNDFALSGVEVPAAPTVTSLRPNVPNPFNPATRIDYAVHRDGHVRLVIYDARGREIATLVDEHQLAQEHSVNWDGRDATGSRVASGVYFYKLFAGDFAETRKMVLVK